MTTFLSYYILQQFQAHIYNINSIYAYGSTVISCQRAQCLAAQKADLAFT